MICVVGGAQAPRHQVRCAGNGAMMLSAGGEANLFGGRHDLRGGRSWWQGGSRSGGRRFGSRDESRSRVLEAEG